MDNASGVATLIEIARIAKESGLRPKRSLLFLAVTGEEKGLLGSEYFAKHPSVTGPIVADLNMDMFLPLYPLKKLEVQGLEESSLGTSLRKTASEVGVDVYPDFFPDQALFVRSDQYNFVKTGVPSLLMSMAYDDKPGQEAIFRAWFRDRYHAPTDDLEQPVDLTAAARFSDLLGRMMIQVANDPVRPAWRDESFFRKFAK
jgi:Zn-dependent M28 family amino/carboxypeptidase